MVTIEQVKQAFGDDKNPYKYSGIDYMVTAISLLRKRIPYKECRRIISGAEHDIVYLCDIDKVLPYISEDDLDVLADCNVWYDDEAGCLATILRTKNNTMEKSIWRYINPVLRLIAAPLILGIILIKYNAHAIVNMICFVRYGGEWITYAKQDNHTIQDIFNELKNR